MLRSKKEKNRKAMENQRKSNNQTVEEIKEYRVNV